MKSVTPTRSPQRCDTILKKNLSLCRSDSQNLLPFFFRVHSSQDIVVSQSSTSLVSVKYGGSRRMKDRKLTFCRTTYRTDSRSSDQGPRHDPLRWLPSRIYWQALLYFALSCSSNSCTYDHNELRDSSRDSLNWNLSDYIQSPTLSERRSSLKKRSQSTSLLHVLHQNWRWKSRNKIMRFHWSDTVRPPCLRV